MVAAWSFLTIEENDRRHVGNLGYEDVLGERYVWDNTVPNYRRVAAGDLMVLRDKDWVLGLAWIDEIEASEGQKIRQRCPSCRRTTFEFRKTLEPLYKCYKCGAAFDKPVTEEIKVTVFAADYERTWRPLDALIPANILDDLYLNASAQQSMRPVDLEESRLILDLPLGGGESWWAEDGGVRPISGGHKLTMQKARYGQAQFRRFLLERFGDCCAISGPQPAATLEAAHLYKYAENSVHDMAGGLLLRRDLHVLFDRWLLSIDTGSWTTRIAPELQAYPHLASLHGQPLTIPKHLRPKAEYLDVQHGLAVQAWAANTPS